MAAGEARPIPIADWEPDRGVLLGSADNRGCIPLSGRYAPLPDLTPIRVEGTLNDACLGGGSFYSSAGVNTAFVGDRSRLYQLLNKIPTDVSRAGGYAASPDWVWSFEQFGDNIIACARGVTELQRFVLGSSTAFADIPGSPQADTLFRVRQQLFACAGRTVNVSAFNNITDWAPSTVTQAFSTDLNQAAGLIQAGIGGEQGAIFQERGIVRVTYTGGAAPYNFDEIEGGRGACSPHAVAAWGRGAFVAAEDGFYYFDGLQAEPIGQNKIDRYFTRALNYPYRTRVWSAVDAARKCVMWGFPTGGAQTCTEVLIYSWADGKWTHDAIETQHGFELHRSGVSVDDTAEITRLYGTTNVDDPALQNVSVDSAAWRESRKQWAAVNGARQVCQWTGANRAAVVETGLQEPSPTKKAFVSEIWPQTDAPPSALTCHVSMRFRRLDEAETTADSAVVNSEGFAEVRAEGRYLKAKVDIAAGAPWTEITGIITDGVDGGQR